MYRELNAKIGNGCGSSGKKTKSNKPNTRLHNVTKDDGTYPVDCSEIFNLGYRCTGVYLVKPKNSTAPFQAFCELSYQGWTVLMRRFDGSVDFYRNWNDYKKGFGSISEEYWLGNDNINLLTSQKNCELKIEFTYWANKISYYAEYRRFKIEPESAKYKLHVTGYTGNSGYDGISPHNNRPFSTWDRDNDSYGQNCAQIYKGAFWYNKCHNYCVPTGMYKAACGGHDCIEWGSGKALNAVIMKIKCL